MRIEQLCIWYTLNCRQLFASNYNFNTSLFCSVKIVNIIYILFIVRLVRHHRGLQLCKPHHTPITSMAFRIFPLRMQSTFARLETTNTTYKLQTMPRKNASRDYSRRSLLIRNTYNGCSLTTILMRSFDCKYNIHITELEVNPPTAYRIADSDV